MPNKYTVKRPLFLFCMTFFAVGILSAGNSFSEKMPLIIICAVLAGVLLAVGTATKKRQLAVYTLLLILLPAALSMAYGIFTSDRAISRAESLDGVSGEAELIIEDVRYSSSYYGYYTAYIRGSDVFPNMTVSLGYSDGSCSAGDVLRGNITLHTLENSSGFDAKAYYIPDGILMSAEAESLKHIGHDDSFSVKRIFSRLNDKLCSRIRIASEKGELVCAVLLGRRDFLDDSVSRDFSRIGISHLLALSGIHLSVTVAALELILNRICGKEKSKTVILCLTVLSYMALVGFTKSVTRAGIMHLIRYSGRFLNRRSDSLTSLGAACLIITSVDPFSVYDTGFVLSVLATYACIIYAYHTKGRKRVTAWHLRTLRAVTDTFKITLLISALTLPISFKVFGQTSLISPLTNIVFIPTVSLFLYLSFIYVLLCTVPVISAPLTILINLFESAITDTAARISALRHICISLSYDGVGILCSLLFIAVLTATVIYKRKRIVAIVSVALSALMLITCICIGYISSSKSAEYAFVTSGKNECYAVRSGNEFVLIDVSDGSSGASRQLAAQAQSMGAVELSAVILTHLHRRHISSVTKLTDTTLVRHVYIPTAESETDLDISDQIKKALGGRGISYSEYSRNGSTVECGDVRIHFPSYTMLKRSSHPVVSFTVTVADHSFAYLGSSFEESVGITDVIQDTDILFFGAHPPVRKLESKISTDGRAVMSYRANEKELLFAEAAEGILILSDGEVYHSELLKR